MGNTQTVLEKIDHHKVKGDGAKEIGLIFDKFSSTKNGKVSHHGKKGSDDYKKLVEAVAAYCLKEYEAMPLEQKDRLPREKAKQTIQAWVEEILDKNHDGVISKEEFMRNLTKALDSVSERAQALETGAAGVAGSAGGTGESGDIQDLQAFLDEPPSKTAATGAAPATGGTAAAPAVAEAPALEAGKPAGGEFAALPAEEAAAEEAPPPVVSCGGGEGEERAKEEPAAEGEAAAPAAEAPPAEGGAFVAAGGKEGEDGKAKAEGRSPQLCSGSCWSRSNGEGGDQNVKQPELPEKPEAAVNAEANGDGEAKPKAGEDNKTPGEGVGANGENNGDDKVAKEKKVDGATTMEKAKRGEDAEKPGDVCSGCEVM